MFKLGFKVKILIDFQMTQTSICLFKTLSDTSFFKLKLWLDSVNVTRMNMQIPHVGSWNAATILACPQLRCHPTISMLRLANSRITQGKGWWICFAGIQPRTTIFEVFCASDGARWKVMAPPNYSSHWGERINVRPKLPSLKLKKYTNERKKNDI